MSRPSRCPRRYPHHAAIGSRARRGTAAVLMAAASLTLAACAGGIAQSTPASNGQSFVSGDGGTTIFGGSSAPQAPAVTGTTPAASASNVSVAVPVALTFNKSVLASSIHFTLTGPGGTAVPGALTYNDTNFSASFKPTSLLSGSTAYTATLSGATDHSGNQLADIALVVDNQDVESHVATFRSLIPPPHDRRRRWHPAGPGQK